jgi:hypothetical protein
MNHATKPTETQLKQAVMLFEEISTLACLINELCSHGAASGDDAEKYDMQMRVVYEMVQRIGWMADLGTGKVNGTGMASIKGGAERWLMHPVYEETLADSFHG